MLFLMLGHTFSDYSSDVHITPISKGGEDPMEYIDVVVNIGSVEGESIAPNLSLEVSNYDPSIGEYIQVSVNVGEDDPQKYVYLVY